MCGRRSSGAWTAGSCGTCSWRRATATRAGRRWGGGRLFRAVGGSLGSQPAAAISGEPFGGADGFALEGAWEVGGPHVVASLWDELGIAKTLRRAARRGRDTTDVERAG